MTLERMASELLIAMMDGITLGMVKCAIKLKQFSIYCNVARVVISFIQAVNCFIAKFWRSFAFRLLSETIALVINR